MSALDKFKEYALKKDRDDTLKKYRYLYSDTTQLIDMVSTYRELLTGALDIYLSSTSNNMNNIMKKLTIITSFTMIPTLIASSYGMNFRSIPELSWKFGYPFAILLMALSVILTYLYFKKMEWI